MAAPELRLAVSLDFTLLRQKLSTIGTELGGQPLNIGVKLDRAKIASEYRLLQRYFGNKTFRVNVETNLKAELEYANKLQVVLANLSAQRTKNLASQSATGKQGGFIDEAKFASFLDRLTKEPLQAMRKGMEKAGVRMQSAGKGTVAELRESILSGLPQVTQDIARGLAAGISPGMKENGRKGARLFIDAYKDAAGIASPSKVFKQIGKFSAEGLEIGFIDGLKDVRSKAKAEIRSLADMIKRELKVAGITVGGLLSPIASPFGSPSRTRPSGPVSGAPMQDPGRSYQRMLNSLSLLTGDPKLYRGRMASLGPGRLPSGLLGSASAQMGLEELSPGFREARLSGARTGVAKIIDDAFFGRGTLPKASAALNTASNALERVASTAKAVAPSGILQTQAGNPRFRRFGGVPSSQPMGIFAATAQQATYPPSNSFLAFSQRATAISAGLPGNVFGGRGGGAAPPGVPPGGGFVPPGGFPSHGMAQGPQGPKNMLSLDYYRNAVRYSEALKVATESTRNFSASQLPFVGGIRALGGELAMATKQVLLYGTAYKALAFVSSLPGQLINAAKGQQQFNNALQVATQDTNTFAKELLFVDNVQRAFGLNLETTRTGFTRLYASMAPANFDSGSIEKLFTGISAATAALQLTPDKAERVTYAFSQMASKGQIMAEELRGQLGDVLPGALSIFAKAAGMSIKDFSKAMEDGEFTGNRFREVFAKVSDELLNRFGTGAQAAGKSLQGLTNVVQSDFLRSLEALSPLADAAAKAILQPASSFLKQFQLSAKIATGELYRLEGQVSDAKKVVDELKIGGGDPQEIKAAEQSLAALQARYQALSQAAQDPAVMKQSEDIRRFTEELAKAGTVVMNIARAIGATLSPVLSFLGGNLTTVVGTIIAFYTGFQAARLAALALMGALLAYRALSAILGFGPAALQAAALAKAFNVLGVSAGRASIQLIGVRTALMALTATTVIGLVVTGIALIAGAFGTMRDRAREAADASRDAARSAVEAARSGNVAQAAMSVQEILSRNRGSAAALKALESIYARATKEQRAGAAPMVISAEEAVALEGDPLTEGMIRQVRNGKREVRVPSLNEMTGFRRQFGSQAGMYKVNIEQAKVAQEQAQQVATTVGFNQPSLPPALPESVDDKEKAKKEKDAEELAKRQQALAERAADQQQQLILKTAEHRARLMELGFEAERDLTNERFEEAKRLIDYEYDYRLARANEVQAVQLNLEKKLAQARINSLRAVSERGLMLREAQMKVDTAKAQRATASQAAAVPVTTTMQATTGARAPSTASTMTPYERALLDTIAFAEGTYNRPNSGYQTMFTGRQFSDLTRHPRMINRGGGHASDAAGRYQFLSTTWNRLGLGAFTPQNQDIGALMLARRRGMNPATPLTRAGIDKLSPEWASFPTLKTGTSYYGQGGKSFGELERFYSQRLAAYSGGAPMSGPSFSMEKREQGIEFNVEEAQAEQKVKTAIADLQLMNKVLEEARNASLAIGEAIGQALPTEQIKLDNQVLAERNRLILAGIPSEAIESAERLTRARGNYASIETAINNEIEKAEANLKLYDSQLANNTLSADEHAKVTKTLNDLLALHRKELASLPAALREFETETLKATLAQLKQADALKAVEEATAMVNSAVEGVVSSYKDLFVDIMSGGDIKEAAKKMQESLSKQVFTMFIDFSMKPVEKFFKDQLLSIFGLPNEESKRAEVIAQMERQIAALDRNTAALQSPGTGVGTAAPSSLIPAGAGFGNLEAVGKAGELAQGATEKLFELPAAMSSLTQASESITANFAQATGSLVQQSKAGAVAASAWQQNLGKTVSAVGIAASSIMGITAGVSQIKEGGISGVLGGIGSIAMSMGSLLGGFGGLGIFGGGGALGGSGMPWNFNSPVKLFANGGVVNGPTLGMVGEGRYSEAIVPLPDGRSIPVKMSDQSASLRDAMNTMSPLTAMAPILSMKFETTNIGGVEYVSRDQLEAAMATTRRQAAKDGAMRGMNMTLDKIQQSPATRGRLGMRRG